MKLLLAILFIMGSMCNGIAQSKRVVLEDPSIISKSFPDEIKTLTEDLIKDSKTDREKLWSIYKYVIENISYDKSAYNDGVRRINKNSIDVLRRRKAVCWGYSELIREMCTHAGIFCKSISGYAIDLQVPSRSYEKANHAWNAVQLDGAWYLLDATWGSGIASGEDYFMSVFGVDYFLTPPSLFIKNHFPLLPMWQLLSCPLSLEDFYAQSKIRDNACSFNYNKKINKFLKLSKLEQEAQSLTVAYRMNRSKKNRTLLGHAIVDIAIEKKEKGEEYFEADKEEFAIEQLEASRQLFEVGREYCEFYPWQEYAYVFTAVNLVQAYYFLYEDDMVRYPFLLSQFKRTRLLFEESNVDIYVKKHVYQLIDTYSKTIDKAIIDRALVSP